MILKPVFIIAIVAVAMIGMVTPSAFAVQTIQGENIPYDVPYGCTSQDVMSSNKHSLMNISLRAYTPNPDVNVVIQADGKIIKNQSIPIKTWTSVSTIFELPNYSPEPGAQAMKLNEIKICLLNTSTDDGEKVLRIDSVRTTVSSEKIPISDATITHSKSDHIFKVSFDKSEYYTGDKVKIILEYPEYNQMHKFDSFGHVSNEIVNIQTKTGSLDHLTLLETGINTGIFTRDILLSGPNGHISYSIHGTSITNADYDDVIVTIEDEFSHKTTSASASISPGGSKTNTSQSMPISLSGTSSSKTILDCTPNSIYVPNETSKYFLINIENPDDDKCTYNVNLYDQNNLKIETLGIMIFSEAFAIDETTPNGNYYITLISSDYSYSESFPLNIQHTRSVQKLSSSSFESSSNTIVLIIIPIIVTVTIVIVFVSKKKSKRARKNNFY
jgi:hypothetical protein